MSNLIKVTDLKGPTISGSVNVPLAELDQMRVEHAKALKLAQELDAKQSMVKVVYYQEEQSYDSRGRVDVTKLVEKSREYKGFEDFRLSIASEEREKVSREISHLNNEVSKAYGEIDKYVRSIRDEKTKFNTLVEDCNELSAEKKIVDSKLKVAESSVERLTKELDALNQELFDRDDLAHKEREVLEQKLRISNARVITVIKKQSFWYWLYRKIEKNGVEK